MLLDWEKAMHVCFIIEACYRHEHMPLVVAEYLVQWGHTVDVLEPQTTITNLSHLVTANYDVFVLKTVSDGPGLSLLEAAEAAGIPTINHSRAIRLVRDKAVATTRVLAYGLPVPPTYFVASLDLLRQVPEAAYPLVVKPTNGSSCRDIVKVERPDDLAALQGAEVNRSFFLAQHYIDHIGFDIKLYVTGRKVFAVAKRSPLHPTIQVDKRPIPITPALGNLALRVGEVYGLDIYGLDVVQAASGPVVVDINDFPSFGQVPNAGMLVARHVLEIAARHYRQHSMKERPALPGSSDPEIAAFAS